VLAVLAGRRDEGNKSRVCEQSCKAPSDWTADSGEIQDSAVPGCAAASQVPPLRPPRLASLSRQARHIHASQPVHGPACTCLVVRLRALPRYSGTDESLAIPRSPLDLCRLGVPTSDGELNGPRCGQGGVRRKPSQ
jgi:hypothetical protein